MRPGQEAPDDTDRDVQDTLHITASMRPGQEAPDDTLPNRRTPQESRFNEAGARSPG